MDIFSTIAFKTSKLVTKAYSTSFSIAVGVLPGEIRDAIYSIYGFVRFADEIVDSFHDSDKEHLLTRFEEDFREALDTGISMNPILHSFAKSIRKYNIDISLVDAFLDSMKADLHKKNYENADDLNRYIYGSADVVGLMCLKVFVNGEENVYSELREPALKLGSAFQKVNFLRDLKADIEVLDRKYFPQFLNTEFDESVKKEIIINIERDFQVAREGIRKLPGKSRLAVLVAYTYYSDLLAKLKRTPANRIISERIRVSNPRKLYLFLKSHVKFYLRVI